MTDRYSFGYSCVSSDEEVSAEPVSLEAVKEYLGVDFSAHDNSLNDLIRSVRWVVEEYLSVTLIDRRKVSVRWIQLYDYNVLPFQLIDGPISVSSIDGSTEYDDVDVIVNSGGLAAIKGDFPQGVKIEYDSLKVSDLFINTLKAPLIRCVAEVFESPGISIKESVRKQFRGIIYAGNYPLPS